MNANNLTLTRPFHVTCGMILLVVTFLLAGLTTGQAAEEPLTDKAMKAVEDVSANIWESIDDQRLKNRTPDQIVAWVIIGMLVGGIAGMATRLKPSVMGNLVRLTLGLAGAFIGGVAAQVGKFDFGWGPVLISYEELACAFAGALVLILIGRFFRSKTSKNSKKA